MAGHSRHDSRRHGLAGRSGRGLGRERRLGCGDDRRGGNNLDRSNRRRQQARGHGPRDGCHAGRLVIDQLSSPLHMDRRHVQLTKWGTELGSGLHRWRGLCTRWYGLHHLHRPRRATRGRGRRGSDDEARMGADRLHGHHRHGRRRQAGRGCGSFDWSWGKRPNRPCGCRRHMEAEALGRPRREHPCRGQYLASCTADRRYSRRSGSGETRKTRYGRNPEAGVATRAGPRRMPAWWLRLPHEEVLAADTPDQSGMAHVADATRGLDVAHRGSRRGQRHKARCLAGPAAGAKHERHAALAAGAVVSLYRVADRAGDAASTEPWGGRLAAGRTTA
mmetsp:Transcript_42517/g.90564  ORF Transcript_42517/g.90564 Transcript_42517/m.90564 type:complete len:333 (+) Transcript_42517:1249-2247(+)